MQMLNVTLNEGEIMHQHTVLM